MAAVLEEQKIRITCCSYLDYFLPLLLTLLLKQPLFYFGFYFRTIDLAIDKANSKGEKIVVGFSGYSLWKVLISF